jgi:hypothetical protein
MAVQQLHDGNPDGATIGQSTTELVSFYNVPPVAQSALAPTGNVHTPAAGATTAVYVNTTFDGSTGASAYTIGDIVLALKKLGALPA